MAMHHVAATHFTAHHHATHHFTHHFYAVAHAFAMLLQQLQTLIGFFSVFNCLHLIMHFLHRFLHHALMLVHLFRWLGDLFICCLRSFLVEGCVISKGRLCEQRSCCKSHRRHYNFFHFLSKETNDGSNSR